MKITIDVARGLTIGTVGLLLSFDTQRQEKKKFLSPAMLPSLLPPTPLAQTLT